MNEEKSILSSEREKTVASGWIMLPAILALLAGGVVLLVYSIAHGSAARGNPIWGLLILAVLMDLLGVILLTGFFTLQPNEARVLLLFGKYKGTVRTSGFHWTNPFYTAGNKISLRARTFTMEKLKVNDKRGNPIEIAAVLVWRVRDTAQAYFDVDNYDRYVQTQSETALRHLASSYVYDDGEPGDITLRSNVDEVSQALRQELQQRLAKAGAAVDEARLTNLSYAPEIAQVMLRRQQAEAVVAARQKIVHGAVSMVDMALKELAEKQVVQLDDERKAAMVSNLLVVLCAESEVHPVVNTGTLYN
jgi:regulator of protease activity HflC (stomatin/prohibitin superfamily)